MQSKTEISGEEKIIWSLLDQVTDPEIPVLSVIDLGIIREIKIIIPYEDVQVIITPTYSGCPAMDVIAVNIRMVLFANNYQKVEVISVLSPAWTTGWISETGKEKLKAYGIAPPVNWSARSDELFATPPVVECPQCNSSDTFLISEFGSTACKSLYRCRNCNEPFDHFKCH